MEGKLTMQTKHRPEIWVLTRFAERRLGLDRPSLDWLRMRRELMLARLYPTVFESRDLLAGWLLSVADDCPKGFVNDLAQSVLPVGRIIRQRAVEHSAITFGRCLPSQGAFLSVRIDSDDLVSHDFFEKLLSLPLEPGNLVSFPRGVIYDVDTGRAAQSEVLGNTFQTFYGKQNIFDLGAHGTAPQRSDVQVVKIYTRDPMRMVICDGKNIANRFPDVYLPESSKKLEARFAPLPQATRRPHFLGKVGAAVVYALSAARKLLLGETA